MEQRRGEQERAPSQRAPDDLRTWLVIAAMEVEERALLAALPSHQTVEIGRRLGIRAERAELGAHELFVVRSGIGAVNAAVGMAALAEHVPLDAVLLLGVAGALHAELAIGDMVVPRHVIQHDAVYTAAEGWQLMAPGLPFVSIPKEQRAEPVFSVDATLHRWLTALLAAAGVPHQDAGTLLSGSEFVASASRKREFAARHRGALAIEMEASGVAQLARRLGIPFLVAKTIADRVTPDCEIFEDYLQFTRRAAENAAQIVHILVKRWTQSHI